MKLLSLVLFIAFSLVSAVEEEENVLVLTTENFDETVEKYKNILVEFYAPWCGHCKSLAPEYAKAATQLKEDGSEIKLAKVDATVESKLGEKFEVRGYPTLKFFRNGKPTEFAGGRTADEIVSWLVKKTGPPATVLDTVEAAEKMVEAQDVLMFGFFKDQASASAKAFLEFAAGMDELPFAISSSEDVFKKYEAKDGVVVMLKNFDEKRHVLEGELTETTLTDFVQKYKLPLVMEFNHETAQKIFGGGVKSHLLLFLSKKSDDFQTQYDAPLEVAKAHRGEILVVLINTDEEDNERIMDFFGMKKEEVPTMRAISVGEDMQKYKPKDTSITPANIKSFVDDFLAGKLKPHLLSQDLPEDWDKKPVKVLVSSNFDEVVMDKTKDVLVEFYAPWCGHCKQLAPIYDELAEKYEENDSILIAKMDSTINELEHTKVQSFPTIKMWKKDTNEVIVYNGERTVAGMVKFLETGGVYGRSADDEMVDYNGERTLAGFVKFLDGGGVVEDDDEADEEEEDEEDDMKHEEL